MSKSVMMFSVVVFLCGIEAAHAVPIHFEFSGDATGSLGATSGTSPLTISFDADTANITSRGAGVPSYFPVTGVIDITGVGTATFTDPMFIINIPHSAIAAFGFLTNSDQLDFQNAGLATYGMTTAFGPVGGTVVGLQINGEGTSAGRLTITDFSNATFQATVGSAAVPEPPSFAVYSLLLVGLAGLVRRKDRPAAAKSAC